MGSDASSRSGGRDIDTAARVNEIEITHAEPGIGRVLVYAGVHIMPLNVWVRERFSAPPEFIMWGDVEKRSWVREMMERRIAGERKRYG